MFEEFLNDRQARIDKLQLFAVAGLMLLGVAFVYSATTAGDLESSGPIYREEWFRQIVWYALGLGGAAVVCLIDYHTLARWSYVAYAIAIVLLVLVLVAGNYHMGAKRWFDLRFFSLQPSEFAKVAFILALANFLSRPPDEMRQPLNFWKAIGLMLLPFVLIMKEPDLGSALVLLPTGLAMLFVAGVPKRFLLRLVGYVGIVAALFLIDVLFAPPRWKIKLEGYQRDRILVYFGVDFARATDSPAERRTARERQDTRSHQVRQALISVGSGGWMGKGWRQGQQTALEFLPRGAAHNDFIFSVIAEEEGFVGSLLVLTLYAVILFTGIRIAGQARDRLGKMMEIGRASCRERV